MLKAVITLRVRVCRLQIQLGNEICIPVYIYIDFFYFYIIVAGKKYMSHLVIYRSVRTYDPNIVQVERYILMHLHIDVCMHVYRNCKTIPVACWCVGELDRGEIVYSSKLSKRHPI